MESTLLRSRRSSSSCSRIDGVMRDLMISERFSRISGKTPAAQTRAVVNVRGHDAGSEGLQGGENHAASRCGRAALSLPLVINSYCACRGSGMPLVFHSETEGGLTLIARAASA